MKISKITGAIRKLLPLRYCGAVIVAAGNASRMGGIDKVMADLCGEPVILRTVRAFQNCDAIREIVIVTRADLIVKIMDLCAGFDKVNAVVVGGADRAESVENGLNALSDKVRLAAIHDGARPLITQTVIDRTVRAAHTYGAAAPGIPVSIHPACAWQTRWRATMPPRGRTRGCTQSPHTGSSARPWSCQPQRCRSVPEAWDTARQ